MNIITLITVLPTILQLLTSLMKIAEELFGDGTGAFKKEWVLNSVGEAIKAMQSISSGGQKETWDLVGNSWEVLNASVGSAIDFLAGVFFPHK